ncbi:S8 family serine peptidase, partial [Chloroflexota bacterium]
MQKLFWISIRLLAVIIIGLSFLWPTSAAFAADHQGSPGDYKRIIVKFREGAKKEDRESAHLQASARIESTIAEIRAEVVSVPNEKALSVLGRYRSNKLVEYVEFDGIAHTTDVPNDQYFNERYQWGLFKIKAPEAWSITKGSRSVRIAILDTGIDVNHPDLAGKIVSSKNFTDSETPYSNGNSHGTHVAGIAAAATDNGIGVAGVGYNASLMNVKVLGDNGEGLYSWISEGIIWATDNGADVINLSLGGTDPSLTLKDAVDYAWSKGAVVVAAAGNHGSSAPFYPAYYSNCIAVAATDSADNLYSWSGYGNWVDVAAPGESYSTTPGGYAYKSGTSMATPFTSGLAGLVMTEASDANANGRKNDEVRSTIQHSCDRVVTNTGYGRINAYRAVSDFAEPTGTITGSVMDKDSGQPLKNAKVTAGDRSAFSNISGNYLISNVP